MNYNNCDDCDCEDKELLPYVIIVSVKMIFLCEQCWEKRYEKQYPEKSIDGENFE